MVTRYYYKEERRQICFSKNTSDPSCAFLGDNFKFTLEKESARPHLPHYLVISRLPLQGQLQEGSAFGRVSFCKVNPEAEKSRFGSDLLWNSSQPGGNSGLWLFLSWQILSARGKAAWSVTPDLYWQKAKGTLKSIPRIAKHQWSPVRKSQRTAHGYNDTEGTLLSLFYRQGQANCNCDKRQLANKINLFQTIHM